MHAGKWLAAWLIGGLLGAPGGVLAAESAGAVSDPKSLVDVATVNLDGNDLFRVRGVSALPAANRARIVRQRIIEVARDPAIDAESVRIEPTAGGVALMVGDRRLVTLVQEDADLEQTGLTVLAEVTRDRIATAIIEFREMRTPAALVRSTVWFVGITMLAALLLWAVIRLLAWIDERIEQRLRGRMEEMEKASRAIDANQLWAWFGGLTRAIKVLVSVALVLFWLNAALGLFPWTRSFATSVFRLVLDPLASMGRGLLEALPDLAFLVVLTFVVRFVLRALRVFFWEINVNRVKLRDFEREWAMPTYRIVRVLVIAFALVVAYPYIPGSGSEAFKGISIFMGVILSIGSSSFIANIIAGYSLTYRRAFRVGDRVQIGDLVGDVMDMRVLGTRLKSLKNEEINIPNSVVIASAVTNFNTHQREQGLILHTEVGIGYDVPWRQVEALLLLAAERTGGLKTEPAPFVLQRALGDFAVVYELNAYCNDARRMPALYSALHANVQDVFNEHGVQIMSPHYDRDPSQPKVVPPDRWHEGPAKPPGGGE